MFRRTSHRHVHQSASAGAAVWTVAARRGAGVGLVFVLATTVTAGDAWQQVAERAVLEEGQALADVHRYCSARVPALPAMTSAPQWQADAQQLRQQVLTRIVFRGAAEQWRDAPTRVEWFDTIPGGPGYRIRKLRFEALPGMWIPALLYEPDQLVGSVPAILNVNGHSPEGKAYVPKQIRCINQAKRGMLALNVEWLGMGQLRTPGFNHGSMNQLDLCGTSGLAPFYLCLKRSLDLLLALEHTDPERVAVTGLSGGGWQTVLISALDTRVRLAVPVAGYSSFRTRIDHTKDLGDSEQTPSDLATLVDYTHLTAMIAPRPTLLTYNAKDDCCFEAHYALPPLLDAARPAFALFGAADSLRFHINDDPGTHNYERDNREALYRMLGAFFFAGDNQFNTGELPTDGEIKSADELAVPLPDANDDFNSLARRLAATLPRAAQPPADPAAAQAWQQTARTRLGQIVRGKHFEVQAQRVAEGPAAGARASFWVLEMDGQWHVPATVIEPDQPHGTVLVLADAGRSKAAELMAKLVGQGQRVVAVDPFGLGESLPGVGPNRDRDGYLFALLIAALGDRPIGIQAAQVLAAARWSASHWENTPPRLVAVGPRTGTVALIAAALHPDAIQQIEIHGGLRSLKHVIDENWSASKTPELFCHGLLEQFDVDQLVALIAPRAVTWVAEP
ncbi:MAG: hypothetical protein A2W31_07135 [Planctomycetes bacterium RBG_16_64_10]|nr:MAG: hypothetical protein A2W31_07135 [Planctomycetes bacterium RBG_16_64_10]